MPVPEGCLVLLVPGVLYCSCLIARALAGPLAGSWLSSLVASVLHEELEAVGRRLKSETSRHLDESAEFTTATR